MGKKRNASRRVSTATRDSWDLLGKRAGRMKFVDLWTGETGTVKTILDMDKNQFNVKCRRCGKWGKYPLDSITDDQHKSGLCPKCFTEENPPGIHAFGIDVEGNLVQKNLLTGEEESWALTDSEIENMRSLLHEGINLRLVKCPLDPFKHAEDLLFVDVDSDYGKAIWNRKIEQYIVRCKSFERWKRTYAKELMELLSWSDDQVSEQHFRLKFPEVPSPSGKKITTSFLRAMREHCNFARAKVVEDWQGFEFSVRDLVGRWGQLDPRRYLIFKFGSRKFCYREIDALALGSKANIVIDSKWCGGEIEKSQIKLYMRFLKTIGIPISRGVFVTADDEFNNLGENIFQIPYDWFQMLNSIDRVNLFIERITGGGS